MRALDDLTILDRYMAIKAQMSELEEAQEALKGEILYALMDEPKETYDHKGATFSIQRRATYEYSEKVRELEEVLKDARDHEKAKGIAQVVKNQAVLIMKVPKPGKP